MLFSWFLSPIGKLVGVAILALAAYVGFKTYYEKQGFNKAIVQIEEKTTKITEEGKQRYDTIKRLPDSDMRRRLLEWVPD